MSGRDRGGTGGGGGGGGGGSNPMGRLMDKLKRSVSEQDEHRDPLQRGYSRVDTAEGSLSTSSTATSLDTVLIDGGGAINELTNPLSGRPIAGTSSSNRPTTTFTPILESEEAGSKATSLHSINETKHSSLRRGDQSLRTALKASKVSFEQPAEAEPSSDEDSFEERREHFQQKKAKSADHRGILKDLNHLQTAEDDRRAFQAKKHVSLDIKHSKILEKILRGSSSEEDFEEFQDRRKQFQSRKHKSLDARVKFNLDKGKHPSESSSESEYDSDGKRLIQRERIHDFSRPIVIDIKDLELSDDDEEDYKSAREHFQKQKSMSTDSRRSHRFFEMDDMGSIKGDNIRTSVPFVRQITQDGKPKLEVYRPTTNPIYIYTQILAAIAVSLGSMIVGFSSGYTSPALPSMKEDTNSTGFTMSTNEETWIGSIMPLAGLFGGIAGGPLIEYFGRKKTILGTGLPFAVSWMLIGCAVNVYMVLAGRALSGFCIGIASLALPVYLGETVQAEVRGTLGLLPTAFGNTGILIAYGAGILLNWSNLAFLGASLAVPFMITMILIPETPRWYVSNNREEQARKALQWLRGKQADVEPELKGILKTHNEAERHASSNGMVQLFKKCNLKPLSISLGLMLFQQLSGINAVIFYAVNIFKDSGSTIDSNVSSMLIGVVNFAATFIATCVIDRFGRKLLLYISSVGMIITLAALGGYFVAKHEGVNLESLGWIPLASLMMYVLCFSLGFGPIPWLMMGEILPAKIRGNAASVATGFNWSITFLVTKTFGNIVGAIGMGGVFFMFSAICVIGLFFVIFCVPETQGKSLEDIERKMMGRVRRMSSVANIRPLSFNM